MFCEICHVYEVVWVHQLDPAKSSFRKYGKGHIWASQVWVCERCDQLHRAGEFEALVSLQLANEELSENAIEEEIRGPFEVYCEAFLRSVPRDDLLPPGVTALRAVGFVPVSELTGDPDFAQGWPEEHRRSVPETRERRRLGSHFIDDENFWLIRSPWPQISLADVFTVIWDFVNPRAPIVNHRIDPDQHLAAIAEFAELDSEIVATLIARRRDHDRDSDG